MERRAFVSWLAAAGLLPALKDVAASPALPASPAASSPPPSSSPAASLPPEPLPTLRIVTPYKPTAAPGLPGPYPGRVVAVKSDRCVDTQTSAANDEVVREMMARGMCALTGKKAPLEAWRQFIQPSDVVGIKVNCGGYPWCISAYEIVAEIVRQLGAVGVPPTQVYIYERFQNQLDECNYASRVTEGVQVVAAETANRRADNRGYDPSVYVEADLFGEEDTRSNMMKL